MCWDSPRRSPLDRARCDSGQPVAAAETTPASTPSACAPDPAYTWAQLNTLQPPQGDYTAQAAPSAVGHDWREREEGGESQYRMLLQPLKPVLMKS